MLAISLMFAYLSALDTHQFILFNPTFILAREIRRALSALGMQEYKYDLRIPPQTHQSASYTTTIINLGIPKPEYPSWLSARPLGT